jgi:hypothetical protein
MKQNASPEELKLWSRPPLERSRPIRSAGGLYRTAEGGRPGVGGVPLVAAQDAAVAAVRMAYRVAEAQIERSTRLAQRLREAGDRAVGARSDRKAVDATEQLIQRAVMSVLTWMEGLAGERDPLRRLMAAQYQIAGSMFGLTPSRASGSEHSDAADEAPRSEDARADSHLEVLKKALGSSSAERSSPEGLGGSNSPTSGLKIVLTGDRRPVRIRRYEIAGGLPSKVPNLQFFSNANIRSTPLGAKLKVGADGHAALEIKIRRGASPGVWKAAVCDAHGVQIGAIEFEL